MRRFDNGQPVWAHGTALRGEVRMTGSWLVRLGTLCCFHYNYPSCAEGRSQNFSAADGAVNFMGNYVEIVLPPQQPGRSQPQTRPPLKSDGGSLRLVFSPPAPATTAEAAAATAAETADEAEAIYHDEGMPAARSVRRLAPQLLADGTQVRASIVCFAGDHTPVWSHSDVPSSIVAHKSWDGGKTWNYTGTVAAAKDFPWSGEGFESRRRQFCHFDGTPCTLIRCFNRDEHQGGSSQ